MNEVIFLLHCSTLLTLLFIALRFGKETLTCYLAGCWLLANFFVTKQILFFGFEVTASDAYAVGGMVGANVLQQFYGRSAALQAIWISMGLLLFAAIGSAIHLAYIPSPHDTIHTSFQNVLGSTPRLVITSFATFFISSRFEVQLFGLLKKLPFSQRSLITSTLAVFVDTILFSYIGLFGLVSSLFDICFVSFCVKFSIVLFMTLFLRFASLFYRPTNGSLHHVPA